jgi:hypothetical protein
MAPKSWPIRLTHQENTDGNIRILAAKLKKKPQDCQENASFLTQKKEVSILETIALQATADCCHKNRVGVRQNF